MKSHGQIVHGDGCLDMDDALAAFQWTLQEYAARSRKSLETLRRVKEQDAEVWKEGSREYHDHALSLLNELSERGVYKLRDWLRQVLAERRGVTVPRE